MKILISLFISTILVFANVNNSNNNFSAGISLDLEGSKTTANAQERKSLASNLNANNINIKTNKDINTNVKISGSTVVAQNELNIYTKDLIVKASEDITNSTSDTKDISGSVAITMYSVAGPSVNLGYGEQHYESDSVTYNNSQLIATNVNLNVSNNADFLGANVNAQDSLNLNVGNDLNIESKRNANNSNSNGFNLSAGFGIGNGSITSANGSVGANTGRTKVKQTVLSSVTGNKVNVNVENNTHLKGSLLASGQYDENGNFIDNGNLDYTTKTLTFSNSTDSVYNSNNSFNVGTNVGFADNTAKDPQADNNSPTKISSTNLAFSNDLGYQRAKTLATLGSGNINIIDKENSDDITPLNRDTKNISKTMVNVNYGVSVDATLDHRMLSKDGLKEIKQEYEDMNKNMNTIAETLPDANSDNIIESSVGEVWNLVTGVTGGIVPSNANNGGLLAQIPVLTGTHDSAHKVYVKDKVGDYVEFNPKNKEHQKVEKFFGNAIMNSLDDAKRSANLIDKNAGVIHNPSYGLFADLFESATDAVGLQTGISKQVEWFQNSVEGKDIYMHSQMNLIAQKGANTKNEYISFGAPMSKEKVEKNFNISELNIFQHDGDYISNPQNIFVPSTWFGRGHFMEDYAKTYHENK